MAVVAAHPRGRFAPWAGLALSACTTSFLLWGRCPRVVPDRFRALVEETGFRFGQIAMKEASLVCAILDRPAVDGSPWRDAHHGVSRGAICAHFRLGEIGSPPQLVALLVGVTAWGGIYLRDARLRALLPSADKSARRSTLA